MFETRNEDEEISNEEEEQVFNFTKRRIEIEI